MNMGSYLKVPNGNQGNFSGLHSGFPHGLSAGLGSGLSPMPMPSLGSIGFSQYMDQSSYANGKFVFKLLQNFFSRFIAKVSITSGCYTWATSLLCEFKERIRNENFIFLTVM